MNGIQEVRGSIPLISTKLQKKHKTSIRVSDARFCFTSSLLLIRLSCLFNLPTYKDKARHSVEGKLVCPRPVPGVSLNDNLSNKIMVHPLRVSPLLLGKIPGQTLIPGDVLQNMHPLAAAALLVNPHRDYNRAILRALRG